MGSCRTTGATGYRRDVDSLGALGFRAGARSDIGPRRTDNQDSGFAGDRVLLIADGVGGAPAGDVASALVVRALAPALAAAGSLQPADLFDQVALSNAQLARAGRQDPDVRGLATTMTCLALADDGALIAHIGDSRAYRWRDGDLTQITIDQSWIQMLLAEGLVQPDEVRTHPMRNLLMHSLSGALSDPDALHVLPVDVRDGDRWVLTTDGLSSYLPAEVFTDLVARTSDPQDLADQLVNEAWPRSRDNITVVVGDISSSAPTGQSVFVGAAAGASPDYRLAQ